MTDSRYILAIDLGTSGPKVGLVSLAGRVVGWAFEPVGLRLLPGGGAEQSPDEWWAAIVRAVRRLLADAPVARDAVAAVSCTAQWSGTVAVGADGRPLMDAVIWMDSRGARYVHRVTGGPLRVQGYGVDRLLTWLRLTGGVPTRAGKDPIAHILFIKHERPDVYRATRVFLEPKDYLNLKLCGVAAATYDSITLHWLTDNRDIGRIAYAEPLLALAGIERARLPELRRAVDVLGRLLPDVARELGLSEQTLVVAGTPDVHSATLGSGAIRDFEGGLYLGTSGWLTCHVPFKKTDLASNMASLPSAVPGRYMLTNEQESAGMCLNFLRDNLLFADDGLATGPPPPDVHRRFDALAAAAPPGSGKLIFTPWLYGERTPVENHTVRGGFYNMSLKTTRAHMVRAVLEGVAYNARWLLQAVERFCGRPLAAITMAGGGASSDVWCQIHADVFGRTVRRVRDPIQANLRGAALLAAVALGAGGFDEAAEQIEIAGVFEPEPAVRALYDELFHEYLSIYRQNRRIYARLNGA